MATDVDVQYFSHLNGLVLGNNWGDLIRLLDKALVTGVDFTQITAASIDAQGDVHLTLFAPHKALLLQVVELTDFEPLSLNQKYRIKGVPSPTQLILKPQNVIAETAVTTKGTGKLASLGYDIIFRDNNDVKRVYRAKNPTAQHPFIRVDESISDGVNSYSSSYAKAAMVGLLESMEHIDDYLNPDVLQLPFNPSDPAQNWKITGTGATVVRGWHKWYWAKGSTIPSNSTAESSSINSGSRNFTLCGDIDAFYLQLSCSNISASKTLMGCGLFDSSLLSDIIPNWFLMAPEAALPANSNLNQVSQQCATPLASSSTNGSFVVPKYNISEKYINHAYAYGITTSQNIGASNIYPNSQVPALSIPMYSNDGYLRGNLKHVFFPYKNVGGYVATTPIVSDNCMYLCDSLHTFANNNVIGGIYYYLGSLNETV